MTEPRTPARPRKSAAKVAAKAAATKAKPQPRKRATPPPSAPRRSRKQPAQVDPAEVLPPHQFTGDTASAKCPRCGKGKRAQIHDVPAANLDTRATEDQEPTPPASPGVLEAAFRRELELLHIDATALGAASVALAKMADQATAAGSSTTAVELLREARMQLTTARGLGAPAGGNGKPTGGGDDKGGEVVQETRLQRLRRERAERQEGATA